MGDRRRLSREDLEAMRQEFVVGERARRPGRRPPPTAPQHQAGREHRGLGQGAGPRAVVRQGASEVPGPGLGRHDGPIPRKIVEKSLIWGMRGALAAE